MGRESHAVLDVVVERTLPGASSFEPRGGLRKGRREIGEHVRGECKSESYGRRRRHQQFQQGRPLFENRGSLTADLGLLARRGGVKKTPYSQSFPVESAQAPFLRVPLSEQRGTEGER